MACAALALALSAPPLLAQASAQGPATAGPSVQGAGFERPVAAAALDAYRGGTQLVFNDLQLAGTSAGNSASQVQTGANSISAGAFANMSGLPVVIQNSGANVLIQNAVIVHVQMN
jgi:hypothetical protein